MRIVVVRNDHGPVGAYITGRLTSILSPFGEVDVVDARRGLPTPEVLADADEPVGVVLGGSLHSVNDPLPWISEEEAFIRGLGRLDVPLLGICFGHQLIARAFGGEVRAVGLQGGSRTVQPIGHFELFEGVQKFNFLVSHQDQVVRVPSGFAVAATSDYCPVQALRSRDVPVFGVQFHPCYDAGVLRVEELACVRRSFSENPEATRVITNFARLVEGRHEAPIPQTPPHPAGPPWGA